MLLSTRLSMLQSREEELQDEVRALNGRISRMDSSSDDVSSLEQKLSECTSELVGVVFVFRNRKSFNSPPPPPPPPSFLLPQREVRKEIQELSSF